MENNKDQGSVYFWQFDALCIQFAQTISYLLQLRVYNLQKGHMSIGYLANYQDTKIAHVF